MAQGFLNPVKMAWYATIVFARCRVLLAQMSRAARMTVAVFLLLSRPALRAVYVVQETVIGLQVSCVSPTKNVITPFVKTENL